MLPLTLLFLLVQSPDQVLTDQTAAWNRGDIDVFMQGYAPDCTFVGKTVERGWEAVRARYHQSFPTAESMGTLSFSDMDVRPLGPDYSSVIGHFHLKRAAAGGGDANGIFTLLFRRGAQGWQIILDHTS